MPVGPPDRGEAPETGDVREHRPVTILRNARLLPVDGEEIARGWLRLDGARIAGIGAGDPPGPGEDMGGDLLMPGMVNTHAHLPMTLLRGLAEDVDDRLHRYILPLERVAVDSRFVEVGTRLAALESIRGGVTSVADMYYHEEVVARVLDEAGLRGIVGQTLMTFGAPDHATWDEGAGRLAALVDAWADHPRIQPSAAPHAPYSVGMAGMEWAAAWAADHPGLTVQMHLAESEAEDAWAAREVGTTPIRAADRAGLLSPSLLAAHLVRAEADIDLLAARGVRVAHNPRSNAKAGRPVAPVEAMRAAAIPVGLATDGPMSGNTLDLFSQLAPATMMARLRAGTRGALPARDIVRIATVEGARAMGLTDVGTLAPGQRADLIRVSLADPRLHPIHDIHAMLVFAALSSDVVGTMVDGRWLMRDRRVLTVEAEKALADARQLAQELGAHVARIDRSARP
jgi:cytosine/adenosine deaminase-related metal-dependent hydrolase